MSSPEIALLILNYNDYASTIKNCRAHLRLSFPPSRVFIIENGSENESPSILHDEFCAAPQVEIVYSDKNRGFSGGFNLGIQTAREAGFSYFVCANSDTLPSSDNLFEIIQQADTFPNVGIIAPQIKEANIKRNPEFERLSLRYIIQLSSAMYPATAQRFRSVFSKASVGTKKFESYTGLDRVIENDSVPSKTAAREVFKVHGSYFIITPEFMDFYDGLDDDIFLQGEEHMISWMTFSAGLSIILIEGVEVEHIGGTSKVTAQNYDSGGNWFNSFHKHKSAKVLRKKISILAYCFALLYAGVRPFFSRIFHV